MSKLTLMKLMLLLLTTVLPGWFAMLASGYYTLKDWQALDQAYGRYEDLVRSGANERNLAIARHSELRHRINCFADGVGVLLGGLIGAVGIHGICTLAGKER